MLYQNLGRVDLTILDNQMEDAVRVALQGIEELQELDKKCDEAVQQNGDQVAWQYVESISEKMMEISKKLACESHELLYLMRRAEDKLI